MSKIDDLLRRAGARWRERADQEHEAAAGHSKPGRSRILRAPILTGVIVICAAVLATVLLWPDGDGSHRDDGASSDACAAPTFSLEGAAASGLKRGSTVTIEGRYYVDGCQDSVRPPDIRIIDPVEISLRPEGRQPITLATAHPEGELGVFVIEVAVPRDVPVGRAILDDDVDVSRAVAVMVQ